MSEYTRTESDYQELLALRRGQRTHDLELEALRAQVRALRELFQTHLHDHVVIDAAASASGDLPDSKSSGEGASGADGHRAGTSHNSGGSRPRPARPGGGP